ncbi:MAG: helix-turn-helix domain-containing protein [Lachnospiraceae bacterium]|nr:helix-turn-helix domain-containing protein [Lachnospiraceae bacterium]
MDTQRDIRAIIAENIVRNMEEQDISRQKLCKDLDVKYTTLCDWVKGTSSPKPEWLEKLAGYFGIAIGEFFIDYESKDTGMEGRLMAYAQKVKELDVKILEYLTDEQVTELLKHGFRFKHKSLEERITENDGQLTVSKEIDWGKPMGKEIW